MGSRNTTYTGNNIIHGIFAYSYIKSKLGCHTSIVLTLKVVTLKSTMIPNILPEILINK